MNKVKPKEPLVALMLSVILPGLGQIYAGKIKRGVFFFFLITAALVFVIVCFLLPMVKWNIILHLISLMLPILGLCVTVDAYKQASEFNRQNDLLRDINLPKKMLLIAAILCFGFLFNPMAVVLSFKSKIFESFKIPTGAMVPTLQEGDHVVIEKLTYKKSNPKCGDVIVFKMPKNISKLHIKRLIGLPGDSIEIKEGYLIINGTKIDEPPFSLFRYKNIETKDGPYGILGQLVKVPEDNYFVLGDYSPHSSDSRYYGFIPKENLVGKAYKIYLPFGRAGRIK